MKTIGKKFCIVLFSFTLCMFLPISVKAGSVKFSSYQCKGEKYIQVKTANVKKGDRLVLKYNGKSYNYKFKRNYKKQYVWWKTPALKTGKHMSVTLYNKNNQFLDRDRDVVYYYYKLRKGMTKKQVKKTPFYYEYVYDWSYVYDYDLERYTKEIEEDEDDMGMGCPDDIKYSSNGYSYWFWDNGSELVFKNGKLLYWYI